MTKKELTRRMEQAAHLVRLGLSESEAETIRRISCQLSRWCEHECNSNIQRDEVTNKPLWFSNCQIERAKTPKGYPIPDRENGATKRLDKIISAHPGLAWYYQGDPRGAAVYIYQTAKLEGRPIDSYYSSVGIAVW